VPAERAGVASGVNNTARQVFGAMGVAVFGAVTGDPSNHGAFVSGLHTLGLLGAGLWVLSIGVVIVAVRRSAPPR